MQENSFAAYLFSLLNGCSAANAQITSLYICMLNFNLLFRFLHAKQLV